MLGHLNIINSIVCDTYDHEFKRCEKSRSNVAMEISFSLHIDYDKEDGYRHLLIRLFGTGYVTVLCNETWVVAPADKMHLNNPPYDKGETGWKFLGCHDSCWRDSVDRLLKEYSDRLTNIDSIYRWYQRIQLTEEELHSYRTLETEAYK